MGALVGNGESFGQEGQALRSDAWLPKLNIVESFTFYPGEDIVLHLTVRYKALVFLWPLQRVREITRILPLKCII